MSMAREILFRGKHICNGEWYEGSLLVWPNGSCMIKQFGDFPFENKDADVQPETVGQYTGHTDKNGKRIWEGDIARYTNKDGTPAFYEVVWDNEFFAPMLQLVGSCRGFWLPGMNELVEVIGNIHDPERLNGTEP